MQTNVSAFVKSTVALMALALIVTATMKCVGRIRA